MDDQFHAVVSGRLRRIGQRYTAGRRALLEAILDADRPMTAAELVAQRPRLPQSTAYRNLAALEQAGVVHRIRGADDSARFELSEELGGHHHHLVCVDCGNVEDFIPPARVETNLSTMIGNILAATGFRAQTHRLDLLGTCSTCAG